MKKEQRYISEIRSVEGENSRHIVGYALLFNTPSIQLGDFQEVIKPEALNADILKRSDVLALLDHNISRGVLARSKYGEGSLQLTIDEKGLKYEFDAPNTALGDELLEGIRRGDIANSSFSFLVKRDEWQETPDGKYLRTIYEFDQLFDVSPVYQPAYDETSVEIGLRGLENFKKEIEKRMTKDEERNEDEVKDEETKPAEEPAQNEEKPAEEPAKDAEPTDEDEQRNDEEAEAEDKDKENEPADQSADKDEEVKEDEPKTDKEENRNIAMPKINLSQAIRAAYSGKMSDEQATVFNEARSKMIANGLNVGDNEIVMPFVQGEKRAVAPATANGVFTATFSDEAGAVNVQTDVYNILEPLRNNLVIAQAGATVLSGLRGNVRIPKMSKGNAFWESETAEAQKAGQKFDKVELKPLRVSTYVEISKALLMQSEDSNINDIITRDIIAAVSEKIESTFFGDEAADDTKPAGLFDGVTANAAALTYGDIVDYETELEGENINDYVYILSPKAKAALRKLPLDKGSGRFVMENGEVLGREAFVTGNVVEKGMIVVDPKEIVFGIWGNGMSILIDPYTSALNDTVRVIVTMYVDVKMRREEGAKAVILA